MEAVITSAQAYAAAVRQGSGFDFAADDWYFYEYAPGTAGGAEMIHIGFSGIAQPQVKLLIKQYAAWRLGRVKPVTVRMEVKSRLSHFVQYLSERSIADAGQFGVRQLRAFSWWLCERGVTGAAGYRITHTVSELLRAGQRLGWQVTDETVPLDVMRWQLWMEFMEPSGGGYTKPIPDAVYRRILNCAMCDEKDMITKAGILIQSQTGLRISEVLSLREDCIKQDGRGGFWLEYSLKKTQKAEPISCHVPANALVCGAVRELKGATEELRKKSGRKEIFLVKNHGIRPVPAANWNKGRLRSFIRRWDIRDLDGSPYPLHSHQFRATYVKRQLLAGARIETVRAQFGHVSSEMTARYVHLPEEELLAFLTPYIGGSAPDAMGREIKSFQIEEGGNEIGEKNDAGGRAHGRAAVVCEK